MTFMSWSIDFAFYHCHSLELIVYIKQWCWLGVFVPLQALALVLILFSLLKTIQQSKENRPKINITPCGENFY